MPKRRHRKTKAKKTARKTVRRRKTAKKRSSGKLPTHKAAITKNIKCHWTAYHELQKKADKAWAKLRADVKRKAPAEVILKDRNALALLLGECNYMTRECMHFEARARKR